MNAVILAVLVMMGLSLARVNVVFSLIAGALAGGWLATDMPLTDVLNAFNNGLGGGAKVALSYATLGAFAVAISRSGLPEILAQRLLNLLGEEESHHATRLVRMTLLGSVLLAAVSSQNLVPVHIAFIPILIPPLLMLMNRLNLDRRAVSCALAFGLITPYMLLPVGFGGIYLNEILLGNLQDNGLQANASMVPQAMILPALGMLVGLCIALFISYRKPRVYQNITPQENTTTQAAPEVSPFKVICSLVAIIAALVIQLESDSMIMGALAGFLIFTLSGVVRPSEADDLFTRGMRMMAQIGFIMIAAAGFAAVMKATGHIDTLVADSVSVIGNNQSIAAIVMLVVGLFITMGIGSSFSTVPIIATLYVPLAMQFGFSPMATIALVGTAGALGDAGSPASDSTLGPTSGLNADGQHDHIRDSVIPTFLHYNLPLLVFGWLAAMTL